MMSATDKHLSGPVLEAVAAGETADVPGFDVAAHLQACARCRETLEAMKMENALFAGELNQSVQAGPRVATGVSRRSTLRVHRPFVYYAVAALLMLAVAVRLVWKDAPQAPKNDVAAKIVSKNQAETGDDKAKPKEEPPKGDPVYEGKTAAQWVAELKRIFETDGNIGVRSFNNSEKAIIEALGELGPQAVREMLRWAASEETRREVVLSRAADVTGAVIHSSLTAEAQATLLGDLLQLLQSNDFAQRRAGVEMLGEFVQTYEKHNAKIREALTKALQDSDRAVVKAARAELEKIAKPEAEEQRRFADERQARIAHLAIKARDFEAAADFDKALTVLQELRALTPDDDTVRERLNRLQEARAKQEKSLVAKKVAALVEEGARLARMGKTEEATALGEQALKESPGDIDAIRLLTEIAQEKAGLLSRADIGARTAQLAQSNDATAKRLLAAAQVYVKDKKFAEARALAKEALGLAPQNAEIVAGNAQIEAAAAAAAKGVGEIDPFDEGKRSTTKPPAKKGSVSVGDVDPFDDEPVAKSISVDFKKTPLKDVLVEVSKKAGIGITAAQGLKGEVTLKLDNTPWNVVLRKVAACVGAAASSNVKAGTATLAKGVAAGELDPFDQ